MMMELAKSQHQTKTELGWMMFIITVPRRLHIKEGIRPIEQEMNTTMGRRLRTHYFHSATHSFLLCRMEHESTSEEMR
jgi:(p)ppGpp synthase/HD superfamily hydrolase